MIHLRIHALINYSIADLGTIEEWARKKGHDVQTTFVSEERGFPNVNAFDMLIILGGIMGAYEEEKHPWLKKEKQFILEAVQAKKKILGICLGSQMLADVLGGKAYPHTHQEVGWWEVRFDSKVEKFPLFKGLPKRIKAFQFHGDTFDVPKDAEWLAESDGCKNQAFIYGDRILGLQFHPEFNEEKLREIATLFSDSFTEGTYKQLPEEFLGQEVNMKQAKKFLFKLLDNFEQL